MSASVRVQVLTSGGPASDGTAGGSTVDINTLEIDGVPTFWMDAGHTFEATLVFRAGIADEELHARGIAEMVQRAAVGTLGDVVRGVAGDVELLTTTISCSGGPEASVEALGRLGQALMDPNRRRERVRLEMLAEEANRRPTAEDVLLRARFGNRGAGVAAGARNGLHHTSDAIACRWIDDRLTAENAVLVLTGPPPRSLRLDLPRGSRRATPLPAPRDRPVPGAIVADGRNVAVSFLGPTSIAFLAAVQVLARTTEERLVRARLASGVVSGFARVGATTTMATLVASGGDAAAQHVLDAMVAELDRVTLHGLPVLIARDAVRTIRSQVTIPVAVPGLLRSAAVDWLLGAPPRRLADLVAELDALTDDDVAEALWDASRTTIWLMPGGARPDARFAVMEDWTTAEVDGTVFEQVHRDVGEPETSVVVGPQGITLRVAGRGNLTILWPACVAATVDLGGQYRFHGEDGTILPVSASRFRGPASIGQTIENLVPAGRLVRLDDETPVPRFAVTGP